MYLFVTTEYFVLFILFKDETVNMLRCILSFFQQFPLLAHKEKVDKIKRECWFPGFRASASKGKHVILGSGQIGESPKCHSTEAFKNQN